MDFVPDKYLLYSVDLDFSSKGVWGEIGVYKVSQ